MCNLLTRFSSIAMFYLRCLGSVLGNMLFMLVVTVQLMSNPAVPPETPLGEMLASGASLTAAFAVLCAALVRHGFARPIRG